MRSPLCLIYAVLATGCVSEVASSRSDASVAVDGARGDAESDALPPEPRKVYVSVGGEARIAVVKLGVDGTLTALEDLDLALPANPQAMAHAAQTRRLYVALSSQAIATVEISSDGGLTLLGSTPNTGIPVYLSLARAESVLVSAYFGDNLLRSHDATGSPPHSQLDSVSTAEEPHAAYVDATDSRIYVPHRNGDTTHWYDVSAAGTLALTDALAADPGSGPRHVAISPDGAYAYVINEFADSISAHEVAADGSLERFQTVSTLPGGFPAGDNTCADIHISQDQRFVYGSNRGHDSIAMFARDSQGELTSLGTVPTEARPREFSMSRDGRFLVVAGQDSGFLHSYAIETDGTLTSVDQLQIGADLRWAIID